MGERLNIEIKNNGKVLANSYYHWSGYTSSTLELTQIILDEIHSYINIQKIFENNLVLYAIRLLEVTGAGLTDVEKEFAFKNIGKHKFAKCASRNDGLISISPKGIEETEYWEEHRVEINLDSKTINFKKLAWKILRDEYMEDYEEDEDKFNDLPILDVNFENISFNNFKNFKDMILSLIDKEIYNVRIKSNEDEVYVFVEQFKDHKNLVLKDIEKGK